MSCSQRKIEANRLNAARSTGPRTAEGKARSSQNAVKHGLTAATPVVLQESAEEFRDFAEALVADLRPRGAMQQVLVERIIMISWKLRRVPAAEEAVIRQQAQTARGNQLGTDSYLAGPMPDPTAGQILAGDVSHRCSELAHLQMYEMRLDRALHACLRQLRQLKKMQQDQREESEQNEQNEQNEPTDDESARVTPSPSPRTRGEGWGEGLCGDEPGQAVLNPLRQDPSPCPLPEYRERGKRQARRNDAVLQNEPKPAAAPIIPAQCIDCMREMPAGTGTKNGGRSRLNDQSPNPNDQ